jgi:hypothetical protein
MSNFDPVAFCGRIFGAADCAIDDQVGRSPPSRLEAVAQHADEKDGNCNHSAIMF